MILAMALVSIKILMIYWDSELYNMVQITTANNLAKRVSHQQQFDIPKLIIREFKIRNALNGENLGKNSKLVKQISIYEYLSLSSKVYKKLQIRTLITSVKHNKMPLNTDIYKRIYEKYL